MATKISESDWWDWPKRNRCRYVGYLNARGERVQHAEVMRLLGHCLTGTVIGLNDESGLVIRYDDETQGTATAGSLEHL